MIVALAIPLGILAGLALGGRVERLSGLRIRWAPLAVAGLLGQVVLFSLPTSPPLETFGPLAYVASTAAVFVALVANLRISGLAIVAAGAASNLAAIVANGGYMPTTRAALAAAGGALPDGFSNSTIVPNPALQPLTDIFSIPAGFPLATVFSVGDVLIAVGLSVAIAAAMRRPDAPGVSPAPPLSVPADPRAADS